LHCIHVGAQSTHIVILSNLSPLKLLHQDR